jgi:ATP-dependent Lon protease
VVLPEKNRKDVAEIPSELLQGLDLQFVRTIDEALSRTLAQA